MLTEANIIVSIISLIFAFFFAVIVLKKKKGTKQMQFFSKAIHKGALKFLEKEYEVIVMFVLVVFALLAWLFSLNLAFAFLFGAFLSGLAGFIGMMIATEGNVRTAQAARTSIKDAINTAFTSSTVMGLGVVGLALLGVSFLYYVYEDPAILYGFALGASSIALFARVGGGIFTKAADVAADFSGKLELNLHEDDARNPASIADNVGDEVGDVAGMGADLFESYVSSIVAAMAIAVAIADRRFIVLPMVIASLGIIASLIVMIIIRLQKDYRKMLAGAYSISGLIVVLFSVLLIKYIIPNDFMISLQTYTRTGIIVSIMAGVFSGVAISHYTKKYTFIEDRHVQALAKSAETGT
ncbi:sodium/proton-translocating pyrophosphatase, partial [Candidatus Woesearchaeota archaeon]|nr:sodium/proton-translocating pyrophosphatase [Candidatus Woesearchaeota archaeon]